jgi:hypothetical protein
MKELPWVNPPMTINPNGVADFPCLSAILNSQKALVPKGINISPDSEVAGGKGKLKCCGADIPVCKGW